MTLSPGCQVGKFAAKAAPTVKGKIVGAALAAKSVNWKRKDAYFYTNFVAGVFVVVDTKTHKIIYLNE